MPGALVNVAKGHKGNKSGVCMCAVGEVQPREGQRLKAGSAARRRRGQPGRQRQRRRRGGSSRSSRCSGSGGSGWPAQRPADAGLPLEAAAPGVAPGGQPHSGGRVQQPLHVLRALARTSALQGRIGHVEMCCHGVPHLE